MTATADGFEEQRRRMFGIAYRILGSAHDAEDVVQDAWLRWSGADRAVIDSPQAWLTTIATRLSLDRLTSARARRETYAGPWLPEPVPTADVVLGPADTVEQRESVSLALLVVLERLTPAERAVYVLREAFGYGHREVAELADVNAAPAALLWNADTLVAVLTLELDAAGAVRAVRFVVNPDKLGFLARRLGELSRSGALPGLPR